MSVPQGEPSGDARAVLETLAQAGRLLVDLGRCPGCATVLPGPACPACGIDLSGPEALRVQQLSGTAAAALEQREVVLQQLRDQARARSAAPAAPAAPATATAPTTPATAPVVPGLSPTWRPPATAPGAQIRISVLLVGVGALLLAVAAIGFLIFSWASIPLPGRAAIIAAVTLAALVTAARLRPRLPETAQAVGALAVVLVLGDGWAVRRTGLFGADRVDLLPYIGSTLLACSLLVGVWGALGRLRAGTLTAAALLPLGILLLGIDLAAGLEGVGWVLAACLAVASTLPRRFLPRRWRAERWTARLSAGWTLLFATLLVQLGVTTRGEALVGMIVITALTAAQCWADPPSDAPSDQPSATASPAPADPPSDAPYDPPSGSSSRPDPPRPGPPPRRSPWHDQLRPNPLWLNRFWSVLTGLAATGAAIAAADLLALIVPHRQILLTLTAGLLLAAVGRLRPAGQLLLRRTAVALTVLATNLLLALQPMASAVQEVLRPFPAEIRGADAGEALAELGLTRAVGSTQQTRDWALLLVHLAVLTVVALLAGRGAGWPQGPWPARIRRRLRPAALLPAVMLLVLAAMAPAAAVAVAVAALLTVTALLAVLAVRYEPRALRLGQALWIATAGTGVLALTLVWTTRQLPGALTLAAAGALLAARRRCVGTDPNPRLLRLLLAGAATGCAVAAAGTLAEQAGTEPGLAVVIAALLGALTVAGPLSRLRGFPGPRPGRASWGPADRIAAALPGAVLLVGVIAVHSADTAPTDATDPALFAAALLIVLVGALAADPAVVAVLPALPAVSAGAATALLGLFTTAALTVIAPGSVDPGLVWALCAAAGTTVVTVLVVSGRLIASAQLRLGAEMGLLATGLTAVVGTASFGRLWLTLLIVGVCAAAIALTPGRERVGWMAGVLLTASSWSRLVGADVDLVEAYTVPPALALLGFQLWTARRRAEPVNPSRPLLIGVPPSVLAVLLDDQIARPIALLAAAALAVLIGVRGNRMLATTGALTAGATAGLRATHELVLLPAGYQSIPPAALEVWTGPAALILLVYGIDRFHRVEAAAAPPRSGPAASWPTLLPGLALLFAPGIICTLAGFGGGAARPMLVVGVAAVVTVVGVRLRIQAPALVGAAALAVEALALLAPWMRAAGRTVPLWAWAAAIGLALLVLGGSYERRLAQMRSFRTRITQMR